MKDGCNVLPPTAQYPCIPPELALEPLASPPATIHRHLIRAVSCCSANGPPPRKTLAVLSFPDWRSYNKKPLSSHQKIRPEAQTALNCANPRPIATREPGGGADRQYFPACARQCRPESPPAGGARAVAPCATMLFDAIFFRTRKFNQGARCAKLQPTPASAGTQG